MKSWTINLNACLFLVAVAQAALMGRYKFWDSFGNVLYDYTHQGNHGELTINTSLTSIWTDRGIYLQGESIEFPANSIKSSVTAYTELYVSMWVNPTNEGTIFEFKANSSSLSLHTIGVKLGNSANKLEISFLDDSTVITVNNKSNEPDFSNIYSDGWKFITIHCKYIINGNDLEISVHNDADNPVLASHKLNGYTFPGIASTWSIKSAVGGFNGYIYDVWWNDSVTLNINSDFSSYKDSSCSCTAPCNTSSTKVCMNSQTDPLLSSDGTSCSPCSSGSGSCYDDDRCIVGCGSCSGLDGCLNTSTTPVCISDYIPACPTYCTCDAGTILCSICPYKAIVDTISNTCKCDTNYSQYSSDPVKCVATQINCSKYDSTGCIECETGYYLDSSSNPKTCEACQSDCSTCTSASDCSKCSINNYKQPSGSVTLCSTTCPSGYYSSVDSCISCISNCDVCSPLTVCDTCSYNYYLVTQGTTVSCLTQCPDGYVKNSSGTSCLLCDIVRCDQCTIVSDILKCSECLIGYILQDSACITCPENCSYCSSSSVCLECNYGYDLQQGECSQSELNLTASYKEEGSISLKFDKQLKEDISIGDLIISIDGDILGPEDYSLVSSGDYQTYTIKLEITITADQIDISFTNTDNIIAEDGSTLSQANYSVAVSSSDSDSDSLDLDSDPSYDNQNSESTTQSQSDYLASSPQAEALNSKGSTSSKALVSSAGAMSLSMPGGLWSFINTLQLMSFIPMLNIDIPVVLFGILSGLRGYSPIPNLMSYMMDKEGPKPYSKAFLLGYETSQFLLNCGEMLTTLFFIILLFPIILLIKKLLPPKLNETFIYKFLAKSILDYKWNVFTRFFIESYIEIGIAAFMQVWCMAEEPDYHSANITISTIFGLGTLILVVAFPFILTLSIYRSLSKVKDENFMQKWGTFFEEFDKNKGFQAYCYYVFFLFRRLMLILCFFALKSRPITQVICAILLSWMMFTYVVKFRPFQEKAINLLNIIIEFNISTSYSLAGLFLIDLPSTTSKVIEWTIAGLVGLSLVANLSFMIYMTVRDVIKLIKNWRNESKGKVRTESAKERTVLPFRVSDPESNITVFTKEEQCFTVIRHDMMSKQQDTQFELIDEQKIFFSDRNNKRIKDVTKDLDYTQPNLDESSHSSI